MKCNICEGKTKVIDTRENHEGSTRRRLKCCECNHRFTTFEYTRDELRDRDINILQDMAIAFNGVYMDMKSKK